MVYSDTGRCAVPDPAARSQFRLTSVQTAKGVTSSSAVGSKVQGGEIRGQVRRGAGHGGD